MSRRSLGCKLLIGAIPLAEQYTQKYIVQLTEEQFRTHVPLDGNLHILPE